MRIVLIASILFASACHREPAPTPVDEPRATYERMHAAACAGDADKFFAEVDEERPRRAIAHRAS